MDCVIVGAGIAGVTSARAMVEAGRDVLILDRYASLGGIWTYYANQFSRVNTSEVGYRNSVQFLGTEPCGRYGESRGSWISTQYGNLENISLSF